MESQDRADHRPQGRPGATTINVSAGQQASSVRAAIEQELPGVPLLPADTDDLFSSVIDLEFGPDTYVGDETLLHHLTGNPATPYDPATAVLVSSEVKGEISALIQYDLPSPGTAMDLRVIAVPPPEPRWEVMFVPEEAARERGITLTPPTASSSTPPTTGSHPPNRNAFKPAWPASRPCTSSAASTRRPPGRTPSPPSS
ncbi:hypothetical protein [Nonomuraea salmonea]|uniref:hypothetical protein n=1 Tax=Nonomuraea salmonea TaxID=46181 RepID=UPI002FEB7450